MKKFFLVATLLGGVSFSSMAAENRVANTPISEGVNIDYFYNQGQQLDAGVTNFVGEIENEKAIDCVITMCGHSEHYVGDSAGLAEYS